MITTEYTLDQLCDITDGSHFSPEGVESGYPMLSVKDMMEYGFDYTNCKHISEEEFANMRSSGCVPAIGDVLVAKDGSYLKEIFVKTDNKEEAVLSSIAIFRVHHELISPEYLCYLLKSPSILGYIKDNCVSGSAIPRIVLKAFKKVKLNVPSREVQDKIDLILGNIDANLKLNNQINRNLLASAKAIFDNSTSSEEVEIHQLSEICSSVTDGVHNTVEDDPDGTALLLSCKNIKNGQLIIGDSERTINTSTFDKLRKRTKLAEGDILLTSVGTIGETFLLMDPPDNIEFQRSVALIKPDTSKVSSEYLYLAINLR